MGRARASKIGDTEIYIRLGHWCSLSSEHQRSTSFQPNATQKETQSSMNVTLHWGPFYKAKISWKQAPKSRLIFFYFARNVLMGPNSLWATMAFFKSWIYVECRKEDKKWHSGALLCAVTSFSGAQKMIFHGHQQNKKFPFEIPSTTYYTFSPLQYSEVLEKS